MLLNLSYETLISIQQTYCCDWKSKNGKILIKFYWELLKEQKIWIDNGKMSGGCKWTDEYFKQYFKKSN